MGKFKVPGTDTLRDLVPVWRMAKPHWRGLLAVVLIMAVQAVANTGRIVLIYPVLTRIFLPPTVEPGWSSRWKRCVPRPVRR